jgi:membrane-associated phospholipid phosphatase
MDILNLLSQTICFVGNVYFMFFVLFLLLMTKKFQTFQTSLMVGATSMLINANLKMFFQIPLMAHLGNGFAFPSGHMQMSTVFYGCLLSFQLLSKKAYGFLLLAIAWGIYYQNYHTPIELLGGFISGMMVLSLFFYTPIFKHKILIGMLNSLLITNIWIHQYFFNHYLIPFIVLIVLLMSDFKKINGSGTSRICS